MTTATRAGHYLDRPSAGGLADVIDLILDKGLIIDVYVRVSLMGIELITIDARIVVASVDTYLRFAEATNRLELEPQQGRGLPELVTDLGGEVVENVAARVVEKKVEPVAKPVRRAVRTARSGVEKLKDVADELRDDKQASRG